MPQCPDFTVPRCLILFLLTDSSHLARVLSFKCPSNTNLHWKRRVKRKSKCTLCTYTTSKVHTPPDNSKIHGHLLLKYRHFRQHHLALRWKAEWRDNEAKCVMCSGSQTPHSRQARVHWGRNVLALAPETEIRNDNIIQQDSIQNHFNGKRSPRPRVFFTYRGPFTGP